MDKIFRNKKYLMAGENGKQEKTWPQILAVSTGK